MTMPLWAAIPSRQENLAFYDADRAAAHITALRERPFGALLWTWEAEGAALVERLHGETGLPVCPIVPNMAAYARDTRDKGLAGAALSRLLRLAPTDMLRVCLGAVPATAQVLRKDFATGMCILAEMELVRFRPFQPFAAFLCAQMGDLAMAFDNRSLFARFQDLATRRYGLQTGVITSNFGHLAPRLEAWGVRPDWVVAPFNRLGYFMYPDREACERLAPQWRERLVAAEPDAGGALEMDEGLAHLQAFGPAAAVITLGREAAP